MTAGHLLDILSKLDPETRVLIPGQEWGWADIARASLRSASFAPAPGHPDMGAWITQRRDAPDAPRERCVVLVAARGRGRRLRR